MILYTFYISNQNSNVAEIVYQFQTNLGSLELARTSDFASINAEKLALLGPNAWRDSCGPLPEIIPTDTPKSPPKSNALFSWLFTLLVVIIPWLSLIFLVYLFILLNRSMSQLTLIFQEFIRCQILELDFLFYSHVLCFLFSLS